MRCLGLCAGSREALEGLWEHSPDLSGGEVLLLVRSGRAQLALGKRECGACQTAYRLLIVTSVTNSL